MTLTTGQILGPMKANNIELTGHAETSKLHFSRGISSVAFTPFDIFRSSLLFSAHGMPLRPIPVV